jgi:hypothetical protein
MDSVVDLDRRDPPDLLEHLELRELRARFRGLRGLRVPLDLRELPARFRDLRDQLDLSGRLDLLE